MVPLTSLWLPILLAAVLVFVVSSVIHMVLGYHDTDFRPLPDEERVMDVLREVGVSPGEYSMPHAGDRESFGSEEFLEKARLGPVGFLTILPAGPPSMGKQLGGWFVYCVVVGMLCAYLAGLAFGPGTEYRTIFRFVATAGFLGYAVALWQSSIWYGRPWSTTLKNTLDGLIYGLLTAGVFGWLWP